MAVKRESSCVKWSKIKRLAVIARRYICFTNEVSFESSAHIEFAQIKVEKKIADDNLGIDVFILSKQLNILGNCHYISLTFYRQLTKAILFLF